MMQHGEAPQRIRMVGTVADAPGHFDGELVRPDGALEAPGALPFEGGAGELRHRTMRIRNLGGRRGSSLNHGSVRDRVTREVVESPGHLARPEVVQ
jgi:hypothetical protein